VPVLFFVGPTIIHFGLAIVTSDDLREAKKRQYWDYDQVAYSGSQHEADVVAAAWTEKWRIYYWFRARGWTIDGGDDEKSTMRSWREIARSFSSNPSG
jgi:hypothetical protein